MMVMTKNADPRFNEEEHPWFSWNSLKQGNFFSLIDQSLNLYIL